MARKDFCHLLTIQDIEQISESINICVNSDCGFRAFDMTLHMSQGRSKQANLAEEVLQKIVNHPKWNPNYTSCDKFYPEDRAMINGRQDVAIKVIKHPAFNQGRIPQVIAKAKQFHAKKVLKFLESQKLRVR